MYQPDKSTRFMPPNKTFPTRGQQCIRFPFQKRTMDFARTLLVMKLWIVPHFLYVGCTSWVNTDQSITAVPPAPHGGITVANIEACPNLTRLANDSFVTYPDMTELRLQKNGIMFIAEGAFNGLNVLEILSLSENHIRQIPTMTLVPVPGILKKLHFDNAFSRTVASNLAYPYFKAFTNLTLLNLGYNPSLTTFSGTILPSSLLDMNLLFTQIPIFPEFSRFTPQLKHLRMDCMNQQFDHFSADTLSGLNKLEYMRISSCGLSSIPNISNLTSLGKLILYNNKLVEIPGLRSLIKVTSIEVHANNLQTLPDLSNLTLLTHLQVEDNKLVCNKDLCWLWLWTITSNPILKDNPVCWDPAHLRGRTLVDLLPAEMGCDVASGTTKDPLKSANCYGIFTVKHLI